MTATTSPQALPAPTHVDLQVISARDKSEWRDGSQRVAALAPDVHIAAYRPRWQRVSLETWLGILAHYDHYATGREGSRQFLWTPPGRTEVVVYWRDRPQAAYVSARFLDVNGVLEVAIASDRQVPAATPGNLGAVGAGTIDDLATGDPIEEALEDGSAPPVPTV